MKIFCILLLSPCVIFICIQQLPGPGCFASPSESQPLSHGESWVVRPQGIGSLGEIQQGNLELGTCPDLWEKLRPCRLTGGEFSQVDNDLSYLQPNNSFSQQSNQTQRGKMMQCSQQFTRFCYSRDIHSPIVHLFYFFNRTRTER